MSRRNTRRSDLNVVEQQELIAAIHVARRGAIKAQTSLSSQSETYRLCNVLTEAVDDLAEHLTGDRELFWGKPNRAP